MNGKGPILLFHDDTADIETKNLVFPGTEEASRVRMYASPLSSAGTVQSRTCAQIACDGKRNSLIRDLDGTLVGGSVAPLLQRATSCAGTAHYDIQTPRGARLWQISFHIMHFTLKSSGFLKR